MLETSDINHYNLINSHNALFPLKVVVVGHVDDGKSTLIGRLLFDTDSLPDGKIKELHTISQNRGMPFEWSFILDSFQVERDQAITVDTTRARFKTPREREIVIIDVPGHIEFLKNMMSGSANADLAFLIIDASKGVREQTKRHSYLLQFLGIKNIAVLVNKMDLANYRRDIFENIEKEIQSILTSLSFKVPYIVPITAKNGDNIKIRSVNTPWYLGPTVLELMDEIGQLSPLSNKTNLRFPIQDIYKIAEERIIVGRIASGMISVGDKLLFSPSNMTAFVKAIVAFNNDQKYVAYAGESVGITLDRPLFLERGEIASYQSSSPHLTNIFQSSVFWFNDDILESGDYLDLKINTTVVRAQINEIKFQIDTSSFKLHKCKQLDKNKCAEVIIRTDRQIAIDDYADLPDTSRFILVKSNEFVACGMTFTRGFPDQRKSIGTSIKKVSTSASHDIFLGQRNNIYGHKSGIIWLTGHDKMGKGLIASKLEKRLFDKGYKVFALSSTNIRKHLNSDLGYSPQERQENIRRLGEVALLFAEAGFICIVAAISPYQYDRKVIREKATINNFVFYEILVEKNYNIAYKAEENNSHARDNSGSHESENYMDTYNYEKPENPELLMSVGSSNLDASIEEVLFNTEHHFFLSSNEMKGK